MCIRQFRSKQGRRETFFSRVVLIIGIFSFLGIFPMVGCTQKGESILGQPAEPVEGHPPYDSTPRHSMNHAEAMGFHHTEFSGTFQQELLLTEEQKEAFARIENNYRKMVIEKEAQIRSAEVDLAALLEAPQPDRKELKSQIDAMGAIKTDMMMSRIDSLLQLKAILTRGQYDEFRRILKQRMNRMALHSPH